MLFHIDPLRLWVHKVLPVVYDDSLSYYEVLAKVTKKLNEVIDLTEEQNQYIEEFSTNLTNAINHWEDGMEQEWSSYKSGLNNEWTDFQKNTEQYIENWKNMAESDIEDAIATGINQFVSYFSGLTQTAVDAAERAMEAAETAAEDAVNAVMPTLENQFDERYAWKTAVGSPLVATTAAGMTDTTKVYVYAGSETGYVNGDWYYYDGTAWQDGGVYNSAAVVTDDTLSEAGVPADAKATGDEITDLKSALTPHVSTIGYNSSKGLLYYEPHCGSEQYAYFKVGTGSSFFVNGSTKSMRMSDITADTGVTLETSLMGVTDCLKLENNACLVLDKSLHYAIRDRTALQSEDILVFMQGWGRYMSMESNIFQNYVEDHFLREYTQAVINPSDVQTDKNDFYYEYGDNGAYVKFARIRMQNQHVISTTYGRTLAQIATETGKTLTPSPKGISDCLFLDNNDLLVYNFDSNKWSIKTIQTLLENDIVLIAIGWRHIVYLHPSLMFSHFANKQTYLDVTAFGAVGNGSVDDTIAIQAALNSAHANGGGTVYIPNGTYLLNTALFDSDNVHISSALHIYDNTLLKLDKNAIIKRGANVNHVIFTHNESSATGYNGANNISIIGGCFDNNSALSDNATIINVSHCTDFTLEKVRFIGNPNNNWHYVEINSTNIAKIKDCIFSSGSTREDIQLDAATGNGNLGSNDDTVCQNIDISGCVFNSGEHPAIGNHSNTAHHDVRIHDCTFYNHNSRGAIAFNAGITAMDIYDSTFYANDYAVNIAASAPSVLFRDNRTTDIETPARNCTTHNNMIDNVYTP